MGQERFYTIGDPNSIGTERPLGSGGTDFSGVTLEATVVPATVAIPTAITLTADSSLMFNFWVTLTDILPAISFPIFGNGWASIEVNVYNGVITKNFSFTQTVYMGEDCSVNLMFTTSLTAGDWTVSIEYGAGDLNITASESTLTWMICEHNENVEDLTVV